MNNALIPYVIQQTQNGERSYDLYSRLLEDRIIYINDEVNSASMNVAICELLYLNSVDKKRPIYMYINSPGGSVIDGMALVDTMKFIKAPVYTFVTGMAASMGSVILSAGEKGHRYALPTSQVLVHQMSGGTQGKTKDNVNAMHYEQRLEFMLISELGLNCGKISKETYDEIRDVVNQMDDMEPYPKFNLSKKALDEYYEFKKSTDYDHWLLSKQALEFGVIDKILTSEDELEDE